MFLQTDAGPVYYEVHGPDDSPAVFFSHGAGLNHGMFDAQLSALKGRYRVVLWDMPGHGRSAPLRGSLEFPRMADYVMGILDEIGVDRAVMVGHSLGSWVSQHVAILHPERVTAVVSIGGVPIDRPVSRLEMLGYRVGLIMSRLFPGKALFRWTARNKAATPEAREFFERSMTEIGKEQFLWIVAGMLEAGRLTVIAPPDQPLLITHGEQEMPKSVVRTCAQWHASVPGSIYVVLPDAGHNANQDNPHVFNRSLLRFLEDVLSDA